MLYDADRVEEAASTPDQTKLYEAQLDLFLDPNDPEIVDQALKAVSYTHLVRFPGPKHGR